MKSIALISLIVAALFAAVIFLAPLAQAQSTMTIRTTPLTPTSPTPTPAPAPTPTTQPTPAQPVRTQALRCDTTQGRLNTRIEQVDKTKIAYTKAYQDVQKKLDAFIISANETGFDTTKLVDAQTVLKDSIAAYTTSATGFSTSLMATKNLSCGESNDAFTNSVVDTRKTLETTRAASATVRTMIIDKVLSALQEYAASLKEPTTETQEETE